jgi:hypothetical protein
MAIGGLMDWCLLMYIILIVINDYSIGGLVFINVYYINCY